MEYLAGDIEITDTDTFLEDLRSIANEHGAVLQALNSAYVAGEKHLARAVSLSQRSRQRGEAIASDAGLEFLLYAAGTRQIEQALQFGVSEGKQSVVIVIVGGNETEAAKDVKAVLDPRSELPAPCVDSICEWFEITEQERSATTASLEALVCERVALLTINR